MIMGVSVTMSEYEYEGDQKPNLDNIKVNEWEWVWL